MKTRTLAAASLALGLALAGCGGGSDRAANGEWRPDGDVTMVVPFSPGGGSDRAGRALAAAIEVSVPDINVKVENREGGSGAVGYSYFLGQKGKARTLLATETALLALPVSGNVQFTGTPRDVAAEMAAVMDEVGGDGFLITSPVMRLNRRYVTEITDGLVPELQKLGRTRREYTTTLLRDHLREF